VGNINQTLLNTLESAKGLAWIIMFFKDFHLISIESTIYT